MKPFDPTKPVQTCDGRPARILCTDLKTYLQWPILAAVTELDGREHTYYFSAAGVLPGYAINNGRGDLVNVPVEHFREVWINFYPGAKGIRPFFSKEEADGCAAPSRIACIRFTATFREGEGI